MAEYENYFKKIIERLNINDKPDTVHQEQLRKEVVSAFNASQQKGVFSMKFRDSYRMIAVAAVLIIGVFVAITVLTGPSENQDINIAGQGESDGLESLKPEDIDETVVTRAELLEAELKVQLKQVDELFAAGDIKGLAGILKTGRWEAKIAAANYLAQIGDESVLGALEESSLEWEGDAEENPFMAAITEIAKRIESEQAPALPEYGDSETVIADSELAGVETVTVTAVESEEIDYSFRYPQYSLRDEPLRVQPLTLGNPNPGPEQAVVLGWPIRWWATHWSGPGLNTSIVGMEQHEDFVRFVVNEPGKNKVWVKYFDIPIDVKESYPIVVMTYRAEGISAESTEEYALYLDDDSGPDYGGVMPFLPRDLVSDGKKHVISFDLRQLKPISDLIGMALGVYAGAEGPAVFDLFDLRFEAVGDGEPMEVVLEDFEFIINVVDTDGNPVQGATVTVDAERRNWARSVVSDAGGQAKLQPYHTLTYRHMIRVSKAGTMTTEVREQPDNDDPITVVLQPAAFYGGFVLDENGEPLENTTVNIRAGNRGSKTSWTRTGADILTDRSGSWQSPSLAANIERVQIRLAHPDYTIGTEYIDVSEPNMAELLSGSAVLTIAGREKNFFTGYTGYVLNQEAEPLEGVLVAAASDIHKQAVTDNEGKFKIEIQQNNDMLLLYQDGYAVNIIELTEESETEDVEIILEVGSKVQIAVVDPDNNPIPNTYVLLIGWRNVTKLIATTLTDEKGIYDLFMLDEPLVFQFYKPGYIPVTQTINSTDEVVVIELLPDPEYVPPEPIEGQDPNDSRRPGYDPFEIFRNIS